MMSHARARAKKIGIPYALQRMNKSIQGRIDFGHCEVSGLEFDLGSPVVVWNSPSIDRIEPALGYVPSNIRIVCFALNSAMGNWGLDKLLEITDAIKARMNK
jgi:hypothetical protein